MSEADPLGPFFCVMMKAAILIDGGYFLKRLPVVRKDINANDPADVVQAVNQLVNGHLTQLNNVHKVNNPYLLLRSGRKAST